MAADAEHKVLRFLLTAGVVAAVTAALARWLRGPSTDAFTEPSIWPPAKPWPPLAGDAADAAEEPGAPEVARPQEPVERENPEPEPAAPRRRVQVVRTSPTGGEAPAKAARIEAPGPATPRAETAWKVATGGACPEGYPVKVKVRSGLYHEPGMVAYDRTNPDRCYPDAATAEADGFTRAKR